MNIASEILLSKPKLPSGYLDVSVGEPYIVRDALLKIFSITKYELPNIENMWEYPHSEGYKPLISLLEEKHEAPVIITNGAKQALGACLYALEKMGKKNIGMRTPYWALIPPLVRMHHLNPLPSFEGADANLLLLPNNPDGYCMNNKSIKALEAECKDKNIPLIHDAAYYTLTYLPDEFITEPIGDVQIFSLSKMLGLSGLRLGYVVCHNKNFYKYIAEYMEVMTVGVSIVSQIFLHDLFIRMKYYPTLTHSFEGVSSIALRESKKIIKQINPDILDVNDAPGMFGFYKCHKPEAFDKAKINAAWGEHFGQPGYVRMNLAFSEDVMTEIVNRLNASV